MSHFYNLVGKQSGDKMDEKTVDRIFAGCLNDLPPVSSKIVRIFTSSTFTDMLMERNTLMEWVYPKIKEYCREKHGLEFQVTKERMSKSHLISTPFQSF